MARVPRRRTKVSFTGQIDTELLKDIEIIAIQHNQSMAEVLRRLLKIGMEQTHHGSTLFPTQEDR